MTELLKAFVDPLWDGDGDSLGFSEVVDTMSVLCGLILSHCAAEEKCSSAM